MVLNMGNILAHILLIGGGVWHVYEYAAFVFV